MKRVTISISCRMFISFSLTLMLSAPSVCMSICRFCLFISAMFRRLLWHSVSLSLSVFLIISVYFHASFCLIYSQYLKNASFFNLTWKDWSMEKQLINFKPDWFTHQVSVRKKTKNDSNLILKGVSKFFTASLIFFIYFFSVSLSHSSFRNLPFYSSHRFRLTQNIHLVSNQITQISYCNLYHCCFCRLMWKCVLGSYFSYNARIKHIKWFFVCTFLKHTFNLRWMAKHAGLIWMFFLYSRIILKIVFIFFLFFFPLTRSYH